MCRRYCSITNYIKLYCVAIETNKQKERCKHKRYNVIVEGSVDRVP